MPLTRDRIAELREALPTFYELAPPIRAWLVEALDLAEIGLGVREQEARREAHRRNCPLCGVANPKYRDGACQSCGEPSK